MDAKSKHEWDPQSESLPVSVHVIALNEEAVIGECLRSIAAQRPAEIVVVDGGSTDETVEIAERHGALVHIEPGLGRGRSRAFAYQRAEEPFVAMVDADDELPEGWLESLLSELESGRYAALQSSLRVKDAANFWECGWNEYFIESIRPSSDVIMVGHPALYRSADLRATADEIGHDHEDTQLSVFFEARGLRQGISRVIAYRTVPGSWGENRAKWLAYGRGYRDFVRKHPEKTGRILTHMLWTVPIVRAWRPLTRGKFAQPIFGLLMGSSILAGYVSKSLRK
jgi:glycosyltransferase involved in cell wall biosynthesis